MHLGKPRAGGMEAGLGSCFTPSQHAMGNRLGGVSQIWMLPLPALVKRRCATDGEELTNEDDKRLSPPSLPCSARRGEAIDGLVGDSANAGEGLSVERRTASLPQRGGLQVELAGHAPSMAPAGNLISGTGEPLSAAASPKLGHPGKRSSPPSSLAKPREKEPGLD